MKDSCQLPCLANHDNDVSGGDIGWSTITAAQGKGKNHPLFYRSHVAQLGLCIRSLKKNQITFGEGEVECAWSIRTESAEDKRMSSGPFEETLVLRSINYSSSGLQSRLLGEVNSSACLEVGKKFSMSNSQEHESVQLSQNATKGTQLCHPLVYMWKGST